MPTDKQLSDRAHEIACLIETIPPKIRDHIRCAVWWKLRGKADQCNGNCSCAKLRGRSNIVSATIAAGRDMTRQTVKHFATPEEVYYWFVKLGFKESDAKYASNQVALYNRMNQDKLRWGAMRRREEVESKRRVLGVFADCYAVRHSGVIV